MAEESAVPVQFIEALYVTYLVFTSHFLIEAEIFRPYCKMVGNMYHDLGLNWYRMPQSIHSHIVHGPDMLLHLQKVAPTIAPGQLSEECSEHFNKFLKRDEIGHAPQNDRKNRLKAMFNRGIERSDPVVRDFEALELKKKKVLEYPLELLNMRRNIDCTEQDTEPSESYEIDEEIDEEIPELG